MGPYRGCLPERVKSRLITTLVKVFEPPVFNVQPTNDCSINRPSRSIVVPTKSFFALGPFFLALDINLFLGTIEEKFAPNEWNNKCY